MTSQGTVAKYLSEGSGLRSLGFPLEVRIGNDAPTFNAAHLAGLVFLLRDAIGDQATVCTVAGRGSLGGSVGLVLILRGSQCTPGTASRNC